MLTNFLLNFAAGCEVKTFFGIPPWYKYLVNAGLMGPSKVGACELAGSLEPSQWVQIILLIALAVVDMVLRVAGLVAFAFIVWGGIQYVVSQGDPGKTKDAQQTIINALVGLIIALMATAIVSFLGNRLG